MNPFFDKSVLRSLVQQGDLLNTVNGGTSMLALTTTKSVGGMTLSVEAPTVAADALNVVVSGKKLTVYSVWKYQIESLTSVDEVNMPMNAQSIQIPSRVDANLVEAVYEEGRLTIFMPYSDNPSNESRTIEIVTKD